MSPHQCNSVLHSESPTAQVKVSSAGIFEATQLVILFGVSGLGLYKDRATTKKTLTAQTLASLYDTPIGDIFYDLTDISELLTDDNGFPYSAFLSNRRCLISVNNSCQLLLYSSRSRSNSELLSQSLAKISVD